MFEICWLAEFATQRVGLEWEAWGDGGIFILENNNNIKKWVKDYLNGNEEETKSLHATCEKWVN